MTWLVMLLTAAVDWRKEIVVVVVGRKESVVQDFRPKRNRFDGIASFDRGCWFMRLRQHATLIS